MLGWVSASLGDLLDGKGGGVILTRERLKGWESWYFSDSDDGNTSVSKCRHHLLVIAVV